MNVPRYTSRICAASAPLVFHTLRNLSHWPGRAARSPCWYTCKAHPRHILAFHIYIYIFGHIVCIMIPRNLRTNAPCSEEGLVFFCSGLGDATEALPWDFRRPRGWTMSLGPFLKHRFEWEMGQIRVETNGVRVKYIYMYIYVYIYTYIWIWIYIYIYIPVERNIREFRSTYGFSTLTFTENIVETTGRAGRIFFWLITKINTSDV
jgi:hypothetical protein